MPVNQCSSAGIGWLGDGEMRSATLLLSLVTTYLVFSVSTACSKRLDISIYLHPKQDAQLELDLGSPPPICTYIYMCVLSLIHI